MNQTLSCLKDIDPSLIKVFVVAEEKEEYEEALSGKYQVIVGEKGLVNQREFIERYFPEGSNLVFLDDDIQAIDLSISFPDLTLSQFFDGAFEETKSRGAFIWSVYPVFNIFFRNQREQITEGLTTCIGAFYGIINRPNDEDLRLRLRTFSDNKEDTERSILYYKKDGKIIRFNRVGFKTKYYGKVGGMGTLKERLPNIIEATKKMVELYKEYGTTKVRKNGIHEFTLYNLQPFSAHDLQIEHLPPVPQEECDKIYKDLSAVTIPYVKAGEAREGFGKHRSCVFGIVRKKFTGKAELSASSVRHPSLYERLKEFGKLVCRDFEFTSIQVNHNVCSPRHKDKSNFGKSIIISIGNYTGSNFEIVIGGKSMVFNTNNAPIKFSGFAVEHANTPDLVGDKYSIIYYNHLKCQNG